nr:MaoC family dehydratase [Micromonospora sp. DSM 115978]
MTTTVDGIEGVKAIAGQEWGSSGWHQITQEQVNTFADATGDHQWIHIDVEKAKDGPFKTTIAHGFLTLSLIPVLYAEVVTVTNISMALNYGLNKVRFPSPVPVGSKVRAHVKNLTVEDVSGGIQITNQVTIELEGGTKPVCVAEFLSRYYA